MTVVVGFTPRPESRAALRVAAQEARLRGLPLHIVRALEDPPSENPGQTRTWVEQVRATNEEIERFGEQLRAEGLEVSYELDTVASGPAESRLLEAAERLDAALLVLGHRRRSPVGKLVLGSVFQEVLLKADCPVLAVKDPDEE